MQAKRSNPKPNAWLAVVVLLFLFLRNELFSHMAFDSINKAQNIKQQFLKSERLQFHFTAYFQAEYKLKFSFK